MGITGGIIVAAQAPVTAFETNSFSSNMIVAGCASCQHTASNDRTYGQGQSSCNSKGDFAYNSCNGRSSPNGCNGRSISASCSSRSSPNGCGGRSSNYSYFTADNDASSNAIQNPNGDNDNGNASNTMSEQELKAKLSPQAKADYDKLSPEGKAKVMKMVSHSCAGKNDCKGQNACRTTNNDCAGKGGCKGQSKCRTTPEQAVKAASMQDKRASLNTRSNTYSPR